MRTSILLLLMAVLVNPQERHARNVILFLGDAGGIPTLNADIVASTGMTRR